MITVFNVIILFLSAITIWNYKIGFVFLLCAQFILNPEIRLQLGGSDICVLDIYSSVLLMSFIIHRGWKDAVLPYYIKKYFILDIITTLLLIILSSHYVPFIFQLSQFVKGEIFQYISFCYVGYFAMCGLKNPIFYLYIIFAAAFICGLYGIFAYYIGANPYISLISILYTGEDSLSIHFLEEERGELTGRTYGTMVHPLAWGQFWNILLAFLVLVKDRINRYFFWIVVLVGVFNICLCGSRSALLALGACMFFLLISLSAKEKRFIIFFSIVCVIGVTFFTNVSKNDNIEYLKATFFFWDDSYQNNISINGSNAEMRRDQLEVALDIAESNPTGLGYGYVAYIQAKPRAEIPSLLGLESVVFRKLVEVGLIGLIIYAYLMTLFFRFGRSVSRRKIKLFFGYFTSYIVSIMVTGVQARTELFFVVFIIFYFVIERSYMLQVKK